MIYCMYIYIYIYVLIQFMSITRNLMLSIHRGLLLLDVFTDVAWLEKFAFSVQKTVKPHDSSTSRRRWSQWRIHALFGWLNHQPVSFFGWGWPLPWSSESSEDPLNVWPTHRNGQHGWKIPSFWMELSGFWTITYFCGPFSSTPGCTTGGYTLPYQ